MSFSPCPMKTGNGVPSLDMGTLSKPLEPAGPGSL